jgi:hypothetical protein
MPWYRTGTATLINSSTTVNGTGTSWLTATASGEAFLGPDGRIYEITSVLSNTQMTITPAYLGSTASAQGYTIAPTQSYLRDLASQVTTLVSDYATVRDGAATGRFPDGTQAAPGVRFSLDDDTGLRRPAANTVAVVLGGADRLTISASGVTGITKADVGLGSVVDTTDAAKPVSTAQQTALNLKANLSSPALTGTPTAPTAVAGVNTTQLATTAYVFAERTAVATLTDKTLTSPVLNGFLTGTGIDVANRVGIQPTLDLDFARQRYGMYDSATGGLSSVALASILTYTGANRTFVDATGVLRVQASNTPRLTFDPVTGAGNGLSVFEARTNLFLNSLVNGTSLATQSVTLGAGDHRLSFFGTGTVAITGTASSTLVGAGEYPSRSGLTFTATAGSVTFTVSGTVQFANLTTGTSDSPFIPTAASAVTAPADVALLTGTNFSKWFNPVEGTFVVVSNASMNAPTARHIFVSNEALTSFFTITNGAVTRAQRRFDAVDAGVAQAQRVYGEAVGPGLRSFAASYKANDFAASMSGGALLTDTLGTVPVVDRMGIGCNSVVNAEHLNGTISRILYFPRALPANLQQLSA